MEPKLTCTECWSTVTGCFAWLKRHTREPHSVFYDVLCRRCATPEKIRARDEVAERLRGQEQEPADAL